MAFVAHDIVVIDVVQMMAVSPSEIRDCDESMADVPADGVEQPGITEAAMTTIMTNHKQRPHKQSCDKLPHQQR